MRWTSYEPSGNDYIPMSEWGKDHWSTLAYLETCAVDNHGLIDNRRMRCNSRLHRHFAWEMFPGSGIVDGSSHPTKLRSCEKPGHDDWSCLEDMVAAGLITSEFAQKYPSRVFGDCIARVHFTELGKDIAARLRQHKAKGGNFSDFGVVMGLATSGRCMPRT